MKSPWSDYEITKKNLVFVIMWGWVSQKNLKSLTNIMLGEVGVQSEVKF